MDLDYSKTIFLFLFFQRTLLCFKKWVSAQLAKKNSAILLFLDMFAAHQIPIS